MSRQIKYRYVMVVSPFLNPAEPEITNYKSNFPIFWIPAFAGMTIIQLISDRYNRRHTREGGYPVFKTTFYDSFKPENFIF